MSMTLGRVENCRVCKAKLTEIFQVDERLGWDNVCGSDSQEINIWEQFGTPLPKRLITVADNRHGIRKVSGKIGRAHV